MRIPSGVTDQGFYFLAVDATDYVTPEPGLATWTVYRSRNGAAEAAMTTPTITEIDATNMPGVYFLLCDEDMTIDSGNQSEAMAYRITHTGMAPVVKEIEVYRVSVTAGETLTVSSGTGNAAVQSVAAGAITASAIATDAIDADALAADAIAEINATVDTALADYDGPTHAELVSEINAVQTDIGNLNDLSAAEVNAEVDTALADYDGPTNAEMEARTLVAAEYATAAALTTVDGNVDSILEDTGTTLPATLATIAGYIDTEITTLQTTADNIETDTQDIQTTLAALSIPTANENADALLDRADGIETGLTPRGALRLNTAALAGKASGGGTGTETFRNAVADSKNRIVSTVDGDGNRTAVATDAT